jgi:hypothetical protein
MTGQNSASRKRLTGAIFVAPVKIMYDYTLSQGIIGQL